jgi:hypothetical protein
MLEREIVDIGQLGLALAGLSGAGVVAAAIAGTRRTPAARRLLIVALAAVAVWPLWALYNAVEDRFGLDSVAALAFNLGLFLVVGIGGGLAAGRFWPRDEGSSAADGGEELRAAGQPGRARGEG